MKRMGISTETEHLKRNSGVERYNKSLQFIRATQRQTWESRRKKSVSMKLEQMKFSEAYNWGPQRQTEDSK